MYVRLLNYEFCQGYYAWRKISNCVSSGILGLREVNRRKHGIGFLLAAQMFDDPFAEREIEGDEHGEVRWQVIGQVGRTLVRVTCTIREEEGIEVIRIISARKLTPRERRAYQRDLQYLTPALQAELSALDAMPDDQ